MVTKAELPTTAAMMIVWRGITAGLHCVESGWSQVMAREMRVCRFDDEIGSGDILVSFRQSARTDWRVKFDAVF